MLDLFIGLKRVIKRRTVHIDNSIFRLHWLFTSIMLISSSLIVTSRQYVGDPIDCLQTDDIPASVLNTYCWIHSTFTIPSAFDKVVGVEVAHPGIERSNKPTYEDAIESELYQRTTTASPLNSKLNLLSAETATKRPIRSNQNLFRSTKHKKYYGYYQWVCFSLFIQAMLFYLPYYVWKMCEGGLLQAITLGMQLTMITIEERDRKRKILNDYLYSHLRCHKMYAYKYFFCEFLCFVNVTGQFYLTDWFFDGEFFQYGIKVLRYAKHDPSLNYDPSIFIFPRMTKCTFHSYGFSGDVQRHDALCMLTLNVVNEKIYLFIWFWFAILWLLLICVLAYRIVILFAWNWRGYFLTKRCTLSYFSDLDYICRYGNIGDWFLLYMMGSNLDPLLMREVTDEMATRMRDDYDRNYRTKQELIKRNNKLEQDQIDSSMKKAGGKRDLDLSGRINVSNHHHQHHIQSSAPPAHQLQFNDDQFCSNRNFTVGYCLNNSTSRPTQLEENIKIANKMMNRKCIECHNQQKASNRMSFNLQKQDDELASLVDNNQATIAANHCLLKDECPKICIDNCVADCMDKQSIRSIKSTSSNKSIIKTNSKIKKPLAVAVSSQANCMKPITKNKLSNASNSTNATNLSRISCNQHSLRKLSCTNECCFQKSQENYSETSSMGNSSSGVGLDFESKLNEDAESNSELSDTNEQQHSQVCSKNQTSGYQSNVFSNCCSNNNSSCSNKSNNSNGSTNNSDTLDQISSLEQTTFEKASSSSPDRPTSNEIASSKSKRLSLETAIKGLVSYNNKNQRRSSIGSNKNKNISPKLKSSKKADRLSSTFSKNSSILNNNNSFQADESSSHANQLNSNHQSVNHHFETHQLSNQQYAPIKKHSCSIRSNSFTPSFPDNNHTIEIDDQIADGLFDNFLRRGNRTDSFDRLSNLTDFNNEKRSKKKITNKIN